MKKRIFRWTDTTVCVLLWLFFCRGWGLVVSLQFWCSHHSSTPACDVMSHQSNMSSSSIGEEGIRLRANWVERNTIGSVWLCKFKLTAAMMTKHASQSTEQLISRKQFATNCTHKNRIKHAKSGWWHTSSLFGFILPWNSTLDFHNDGFARSFFPYMTNTCLFPILCIWNSLTGFVDSSVVRTYCQTLIEPFEHTNWVPWSMNVWGSLLK